MHLPSNCAVSGNIHTHPIWKVTGYSEGSVKVMEKLSSRKQSNGGGGGWNFKSKKKFYSRKMDIFWDVTRKKVGPIPEEIITDSHRI